MIMSMSRAGRLSLPRSALRIGQRQYSLRPIDPPPPPPQAKPTSPHAQVYSSLLPSMIPIFLLGSAVYLSLELWRVRLEHEKYMYEAGERVAFLEAEIADAGKPRKSGKETLDQIQGTGSSKSWYRFW
ncbi:hypothetical protein CYLTODRAFT_417457 [Cylindrobasidium torrendii FP15055 ss-10]|uniref:Uncharacterized protein n=1 Tax=Cylindrobasidium torrendii FP15055 ss-10 TaxID=1314674 RepID=A0A0D7BRS4_9AGAR|nr:hypothetical protein CYLTODRAFT_417457 [Cylindrobasidium torrendii FP15055 ss-10]